MALGATVYRAALAVSDLDRGYYAEHTLVLARHPSETEERLMLRLLAWAMHADPALEFGRGLSTEEDPDLWLREASGEIRLWIELGLPEERRLRRAAGRARELVLIAYGGRAVEPWWTRNAAALKRLARLRIVTVDDATLRELAGFARRSMQLQCTIQDGQLWLSDAERSLLIEPQLLHPH